MNFLFDGTLAAAGGPTKVLPIRLLAILWLPSLPAKNLFILYYSSIFTVSSPAAKFVVTSRTHAYKWWIKERVILLTQNSNSKLYCSNLDLKHL